METQLSKGSLPDEILLRVITHLPTIFDVRNIRGVCMRWKSVVDSHGLKHIGVLSKESLFPACWPAEKKVISLTKAKQLLEKCKRDVHTIDLRNVALLPSFMDDELLDILLRGQSRVRQIWLPSTSLNARAYVKLAELIPLYHGRLVIIMQAQATKDHGTTMTSVTVSCDFPQTNGHADTNVPPPAVPPSRLFNVKCSDDSDYVLSVPIGDVSRTLIPTTTTVVRVASPGNKIDPFLLCFSAAGDATTCCAWT